MIESSYRGNSGTYFRTSSSSFSWLSKANRMMAEVVTCFEADPHSKTVSVVIPITSVSSDLTFAGDQSPRVPIWIVKTESPAVMTSWSRLGPAKVTLAVQPLGTEMVSINSPDGL